MTLRVKFDKFSAMILKFKVASALSEPLSINKHAGSSVIGCKSPVIYFKILYYK